MKLVCVAVKEPKKWPWAVALGIFVLLLAISGPVTSFGDGTHVVGTDIRPGTYHTMGPAQDGPGYCHWARLKRKRPEDTNSDFGPIIASDLGNGPSTVTIKPSDGAFKTSGCDTWSKVN
jgi:hypothetical protein